jgi:hypothetical protein
MCLATDLLANLFTYLPTHLLTYHLRDANVCQNMMYKIWKDYIKWTNYNINHILKLLLLMTISFILLLFYFFIIIIFFIEHAYFMPNIWELHKPSKQTS